MLYFSIAFFILATACGLFGFTVATGMAAAVAKNLCFLFAMFFAMSVFFWRWRP